MRAIDIEKDVKVFGTAYYRLPDNLFKFIQQCEAKDCDVVGFEYTKGDRTFGIILEKNK